MFKLSYSIFFNSEKGKGKISSDTYLNYFKNRQNYNVSDVQAWYENKATGVYFSFWIETDYDIEFNLNVFRPHYFALEAVQEILSFLKEFPSTIYDPQLEYTGKFNENKFFEKWQENNKSACKIAELGSHLTEHRLIPTALLNEFWEWNYGLEHLSATTFAGLDIFIPQLSLYEEGKGNVKLLSLWPESLPIVLPRNIDVMLGITDQSTGNPILSIVEYSSISSLIEKYEQPQSNHLYAVVNYPTIPEDIAAVFHFKHSKLIKPNCLLNSEIVINEEYF